MATMKASSSWGREADVYRLFAEPPSSRFTADPVEDAPMAAVLLELDGEEQETGRIAGQETGRIAGFEVVGFLGFQRRDALPDLGILWQLPGWEPLPLAELLKRKQQELRQRHKAGAA